MDRLDILIDTLNEKLIDNDMNKAQLAQKLEMDHTVVLQWFNKEFCPRIVNLIRLSNLFNCSIDYLLGLTDIEAFTPSKKSVDFITRFDELQKLNNLNDNRVALHCGIGNSAVAKWRRFRRYPETLTAIKLAELFGCTIEYLIGRSDNK